MFAVVVLVPVASLARDAVPRTADGRPDPSGVWNLSTATPMQRPEELAGKTRLTAEEAVQYEAQLAERRRAVVPLDGRPHLPASLRQWAGDSRASWDGDTLVVETSNFLRETSFGGSSANLHLVERFTRTGPETLTYSFTAMDPTTWTRPWTAEVQMTLSSEPLYEYACHEGNYSMASSLTGTWAVREAAAGEQ